MNELSAMFATELILLIKSQLAVSVSGCDITIFNSNLSLSESEYHITKLHCFSFISLWENCNNSVLCIVPTGIVRNI